MEETYYAGAYWGARRESAAECAKRLETFLSGLPSADPALARWFQLGKSRKDALKRPIVPNHGELEQLVLRGRDRVFEDLGFRVRGWNGADADEDAVDFDVLCGGYTDAVSNVCVFDLPNRGAHANRILTAPALAATLRATAIAWEPEWAIATSSTHRDLVTSTPKAGTFVGWIMYLSRRIGTVPPLPAPVRIEAVEDKGSLIILTSERFTVGNPEHVELAERVRELLGRAGLLKPIQART
ncbi:immunity 52 family protein [Myxococcus landrumensis]|uniref:Immunity 52 family protein n=1 Tax=Myxococcus landrumensis TaxID=2813577 RepID=A0ABX7N7Y2_9BACT|nr:immunity 52 family protein [Myxococcus landrumus]QSQ14867.1 immunity 52 family protein [Myxococcus landrumus]